MESVPGAPGNELDGLIHKILNHLHGAADEDKLKRVIESELMIRYGFYNYEIDSERYVVEVTDWWDDRN